MAQPSEKVKTLQGILTALLLIPLSYYIFTHKSDLAVIFEISWASATILVMLVVITSFFNAAQNAVLIRSFGTPLSNLESFGLSNISALINIVVPQGLTITKAVYLKQRYGVSYSRFSALFLGLLVVFISIGALLLTFTNTFAALQNLNVPWILWFGCVLGIGSSLLFAFSLPKHIFGKFGKAGVVLESFLDGWNQIRVNRVCLLKASLWQVMIFIGSGISLAIAYQSIGSKISIVVGISLAILISFSNLLSIIPGNLVIQEVIYGYLSYTLGLPFVHGVIVSALMRAVSLLVTLAMAPLSWYFLFFRHRIKVVFSPTKD